MTGRGEPRDLLMPLGAFSGAIVYLFIVIAFTSYSTGMLICIGIGTLWMLLAGVLLMIRVWRL